MYIVVYLYRIIFLVLIFLLLCVWVCQVMLYSGQLDVIVALPLTQAMLQTVNWQYLHEYQRANRAVWKVKPDDVEVAGYVRRVHNFYQVLPQKCLF